MFAYIEQDSLFASEKSNDKVITDCSYDSYRMSFVFPCAANYNFLTGISCNVDCRKNSIEEFAEKTPGIYSCQCSFHGIDVGFTWIE